MQKKEKKKKKWMDYTWKKEKTLSKEDFWKYMGTDSLLLELYLSLSKLETKYKVLHDDNLCKELIPILEVLRCEPMRSSNPMIEKEKERAIKEDLPLTNVEDYLLVNFVESSNINNLENNDYVKQIELKRKQDENKNKRIKFASSTSSSEIRQNVWREYEESLLKFENDCIHPQLSIVRHLLPEGLCYIIGDYYKVDEKEIFIEIINKLLLKYELKNDVSLSVDGLNSKHQINCTPKEIKFSKSVNSISASGNTILMSNSRGGIAIGGPTSCAGPICLGNITRPKEWNSLVSIDLLLGFPIAKVCCGPYHFCAITSTYHLITWGLNVDLLSDDEELTGQLGHTYGPVCPPILLDQSKWESHRSQNITNTQENSEHQSHHKDLVILDVACGSSHTVILTQKGVFTCGSNKFGQLGRSKRKQKNDQTSVYPYRLKKQSFMNLNADPIRILQIASGLFHSLALDAEGNVWGWGKNHRSQIARSNAVPHFPTPIRVIIPQAISRVIQVACGSDHCIALTSNGEVYGWGDNYFGQVGVPSPALITDPKKISFDNNELICKVSSSCYTSSAINEYGEVYMWGCLGDDFQKHQFSPKKFERLADDLHYVVNIAHGLSHSIFVSNEPLSRAVKMIQSSSFGDNAYNKLKLIKILIEVPNPEVTLDRIQNRVSRSLHLKSPVRSYAVISNSFIHFEIPSSTNNLQLKKKMKIRNPTNSKLKIDIFSQYFYVVEDIRNRKFSILFTPNSFTLNKDESQHIEVELNIASEQSDDTNDSTNSIYNDIYALFSFMIKQPNSESVRLFSFVKISTFDEQEIVTSNFNSRYDESESAEGDDNSISSSLATYLPNVLLRQLQASTSFEDGHPPSEPSIQQFPAAILFLDISGFTMLNERLAQLGPAKGPEIVTKHINSYFSSLIAAVDEHGGDTLKFAGDALICLFGYQNCEEPLEVVTLRAVQCALDIQTRLAVYDSNEGFSLTLHVGVGAGNLYSLYVGGVEASWEYLVSGEPLAQLRTCVELSNSGQVVVSPEIWKLISHRCEGEVIEKSERGDIWVKKVIDTVSASSAAMNSIEWKDQICTSRVENTIRCFIPQAVQTKLFTSDIISSVSNRSRGATVSNNLPRLGRRQTTTKLLLKKQQSGSSLPPSVNSSRIDTWNNELRVITILFVKLNSDIKCDQMNEFCLSLHNLLIEMQTIIFRYEGMVRQFLSDDKGTVLIAAFGVPPFSHAEGALRGVKAAVEIHKSLELGLKMSNSIGVTTGQVFCGDVGSSSRREYAMVGDVVNLSARLMVAAEKMKTGVLCDVTTKNACKTKQAFKSLGLIDVKGKKQKIEIFAPISSSMKKKSDITDDSDDEDDENRVTFNVLDLFGRSAIIEKIQKTISKFGEENRNDLIIVEGDYGSGKTTICNYLRSVTTNFKVINITIDSSISSSTPFFICKYLLADLLDLPKDMLRVSMISSSVNRYKIDWDEVYKKLRNTVGPSFSSSLIHLNRFLPALSKVITPSDDENEEEDETKLSIAQKNLRIVKLILKLLEETSRVSPILLIIEDIHWIDLLSLSLITSIAENVKKLFIFVTMRPLSNQDPAEYEKLFSLPHCYHHKLPPLKPEDCNALAAKILGVSSIPPPVQQIITKSQGNPMFCLEIAYHLRDSEFLSIDKQTNSLILSPNFNELILPATVQGIIASRFDTLPSSVQLVLKVASVIGAEFNFQLLKEIYTASVGEVTNKQLYEALERAEADFIEISQFKQSFKFKNGLEDIAYSRLLYSQRFSLHKQIAQIYEYKVENETNLDLSSLYPSTAYHFKCVFESQQLLESSSESTQVIDEDSLVKSIMYYKLAGEITSQISIDDCRKYYSLALQLVDKLSPQHPRKAQFVKELRLKLIGKGKVQHQKLSPSLLPKVNRNN